MSQAILQGALTEIAHSSPPNHPWPHRSWVGCLPVTEAKRVRVSLGPPFWTSVQCIDLGRLVYQARRPTFLYLFQSPRSSAGRTGTTVLRTGFETLSRGPSIQPTQEHLMHPQSTDQIRALNLFTGVEHFVHFDLSISCLDEGWPSTFHPTLSTIGA